ncbi:MAG: hypothetical protein AAGF88_05240 [Pseudomonadota bacterium]
MTFADEFWLNATATQRNMRHMVNYGAAFYGTATLQAWKLGIDAPLAFWQAVARVGGTPATGFKTRAQTNPVAPPVAKDVEPLPSPVETVEDVPPDDLTALSGVGAKLADTLNGFHIYRYDQLAALTDADIDALNERQPGFKALVKRFDLVGQAKSAVS